MRDLPHLVPDAAGGLARRMNERCRAAVVLLARAENLRDSQGGGSLGDFFEREQVASTLWVSVEASLARSRENISRSVFRTRNAFSPLPVLPDSL
jgi:hypothetical protein